MLFNSLDNASSPNFLPKQYFPELDGLRGLAILAVMFVHVPVQSLRPFFTLGWVGVDLFFVLSGFLITGILLDNKGNSKFFTTFYARRILRVFPVYYLVLLLVFVVGPAIYPSTQVYVVTPASYFLIFLQNVLLDLHGRGPLTVTWSLAIEEQFYAVWPLLVSLVPTQILTRLLIGVFLLSPLLRMIVVRFGIWEVEYHTLSRLDGLAIGSLIALWLRQMPRPLNQVITYSRVAFAAGTLGTALLIVHYQGDIQQSAFSFTFLALAFSGLLGLTLVASKSSSKSLLSHRYLRFTGRISYGMYLTHLFVFLAFSTKPARQLFERVPNPYLADTLLIGSSFTLAFSIAIIIWYSIERPILSLKQHFNFASEV